MKRRRATKNDYLTKKQKLERDTELKDDIKFLYSGDFDLAFFDHPPTRQLPSHPVYGARLLLDEMNASQALQLLGSKEVKSKAHVEEEKRPTLFDDFKTRCPATWLICVAEQLMHNALDLEQLAIGDLVPSKLPPHIWANLFSELRDDITTFVLKNAYPEKIINLLGGDGAARQEYDASVAKFHDRCSTDLDLFRRFGQFIRVKTWKERNGEPEDEDERHWCVDKVVGRSVVCRECNSPNLEGRKLLLEFKAQRVKCGEAEEIDSDSDEDEDEGGHDFDDWRFRALDAEDKCNRCLAYSNKQHAHVVYRTSCSKDDEGYGTRSESESSDEEDEDPRGNVKRCYELQMTDFRWRCNKSDSLVRAFSAITATELGKALEKTLTVMGLKIQDGKPGILDDWTKEEVHMFGQTSFLEVLPTMWLSETGWRHSGWKRFPFDLNVAYLTPTIGVYLPDTLRDLCIQYCCSSAN